MNTAYKSNVYPINRGDNGIVKSRSKKDVLLDTLRKCIALKHYSKSTERAYVGYVSEYIDFRQNRQSQEHGAKAIEEYLTHLAVEKHVAASTQNVAFNTTMIYTHVMQKKSAVKSPLDRMMAA